MKFIEDQLINVLRETPPETDCSVSVTALEMAGVKGEAQQQRWLATKRPPIDGKTWHLIGEHWHFGAHFEDEDPGSPPAASPAPALPHRQSSSTIQPIIVKPVRELPHLRR